MTAYPRVGVGVIVVDSQGRILLGERCNSHGARTWGPPGGHLEFGETFEACAIREVQEEVGLEVENPKLIGFTNDVFEAEGKHYVSFFLQVDLPLNQQIQVLEPDKVKSWQWFSLDKLPENLFLTLKSFVKKYPGIDEIRNVLTGSHST